MMVRFTTSRICPYCGMPMERIRRKPWHRLLSLFTPVIHVVCCNKHYLLFVRHNQGAAQEHGGVQEHFKANEFEHQEQPEGGSR